MVRQAVGHLSRLGEDGWIHPFARTLPEHRQLEEICRCALRFPPQHVGELLVDLAVEEGRHLGPENLSEQGMTETDARGTLASDGNQSSPLEFDQDPVSGHLFRHGESKRFTDRQAIPEIGVQDP